MRLFGRSRSEPEEEAPEPAFRRRRLGPYAAYVPVSARSPEMQRLAVHDAIEDDADGPDEDVRFLRALAEGVEQAAVPPPAPAQARVPAKRPGIGRTQVIDDFDSIATTDATDEHLALFRGPRAEDERQRVVEVMDLHDTEIADVIEDLSTTAAALRRRRAA